MINSNCFVRLLISTMLIIGLYANRDVKDSDPNRGLITVTTSGQPGYCLFARFKMPEDRVYARKFYPLVPGTTQKIDFTGHANVLTGISIIMIDGKHSHCIDAPIAHHYNIICTQDGPKITYS